MKYLLTGIAILALWRAVAWLAAKYLDEKRPYTDDEVAEYHRRIDAHLAREEKS